MVDRRSIRCALLFLVFSLSPSCGKDDGVGFGGGGTPSERDPNEAVQDAGTSDSTDSGDTGRDSTDTGSTTSDVDDETDDDSSIEPFSVTGFTVTDCTEADAGPSLELNYDESGGHVQVKHSGHQANCCAEFSLTATGTSDGELTVVYDEGDPDCNCICGYDLRYQLVGLPSGEWRIRIPDSLNGTVTIP